MIIVKIMGGIGNQLFQYAIGRMLSLKVGTELKLDLTWFSEVKEVKGGTKRKFKLDALNINYNKASFKDIKKILLLQTTKIQLLPIYKFLNLGYKFRNILFQRSIFIEPHFMGYNPLIEKAHKNSYLNGYWQSEHYFKHISDIIRNDLMFINAFPESYLPFLKILNETETVSIHVRRGDYIINKNINLLSEVYYKMAIKELQKRLQRDLVFVVFSDDMKWCEQNLLLDGKVVYVAPAIQDDVDDLHLMSLCRHNIIANSSFSWWGAWLNPNPDKIVIAPEKWFISDKRNSLYQLPEGWIRI